MGKKEKLEARLKSCPKDFTFDEMVTLMGYYDLMPAKTGKTGGSRVRFVNKENGMTITMHKPHNPEGKNVFKAYMIRLIIDQLEQEELL